MDKNEENQIYVKVQTNKMGGDMEANKKKFIEDWGTMRENLEHNFCWTRRNLAIVGIFRVVIPYLVYKGTVREFVLTFKYATHRNALVP
ncbi:putative NADH:ubiquinone reductase (H(+)-translocating) [Helianthus annuus]|nr:putative NADH:ubiquinone reductase (H(+)-translocating) [Helianthus annuus]KAJ0847623.1 putative NADH:ubiquinone reductase (H(+)-translocating) [Helianthus annuus]